MSSLVTNPIKALAYRFVCLPPLVRMKLSKRLLELYSSEQASRDAGTSSDSSGPVRRKSFLEQFWNEVEEAHGDHSGAVNPFTEESRARAGKGKDAAQTDEQGGFLPWRMERLNLISRL